MHAVDTFVSADSPLETGRFAVVPIGSGAVVRALDNSSVAPPVKATTSMRYSIGSVSKQFTATAILMLAEEGKLSLDDKVSRFVPGLTRGDEISIRQLLSMTSGYSDYWPQDYVMPPMKQPTPPKKSGRPASSALFSSETCRASRR